jgi:hypothetical protein
MGFLFGAFHEWVHDDGVTHFLDGLSALLYLSTFSGCFWDPAPSDNALLSCMDPGTTSYNHPQHHIIKTKNQ